MWSHVTHVRLSCFQWNGVGSSQWCSNENVFWLYEAICSCRCYTVHCQTSNIVLSNCMECHVDHFDQCPLSECLVWNLLKMCKICQDINDQRKVFIDQYNSHMCTKVKVKVQTVDNGSDYYVCTVHHNDDVTCTIHTKSWLFRVTSLSH